ncbi:MAG TPA: FadR/GntR family transcriptional regulator [Bacillota bacterium]|mgnify:CR=1 FL=1|jgi:GntR family transcriptional repressor for pyruvate dehydrogenase complex|nr:FadR family transcriptional regulator [Bacillota bacterium]HOA35655.1 FadR/GntR family transcriptional regulator [Bacillota bacterium]HOJ84682.1 FadR/GntR family transcriptional regulator [Bacillota bacterium]HOL15241.1 FadR/GntR family transcriptional regulator [Bacillota bacterium]HPZ11872.1 FadR/GntR family transcriptional regulator [Bacillota bacterium]
MRTGLSARIFEEIRTAIINEIYPIGSKLPTERELAEQYGASRFAVREAMAMLSQEGFVETLPQSGTYVKDFYSDGTLDTLVQTLRIRRVIERQTLISLLKFRATVETNAAAEAALRINSKDIAYLTANLQRKRENLDNIAALTECDYDFHYKIVSVSGNIISKLVFQSFKPIYSFFTEFYYSLPGVPQASLELNLKLLEALKQGDKESSFKAMEAILHFGERKIFESIDDREELIVIRRVNSGE